MDRNCVAVLDKINSLASPGHYVVFSEEELEEALPENTDGDDLKKCLKSLLNEGYIDVKYSSGNLYCIAPLKNYEEEIIPPEPEPEVTEKIKRPLSPFFAAFLGGASGSFIVCLIFALIGYAG